MGSAEKERDGGCDRKQARLVAKLVSSNEYERIGDVSPPDPRYDRDAGLESIVFSSFSPPAQEACIFQKHDTSLVQREGNTKHSLIVGGGYCSYCLAPLVNVQYVHYRRHDCKFSENHTQSYNRVYHEISALQVLRSPNLSLEIARMTGLRYRLASVQSTVPRQM